MPRTTNASLPVVEPWPEAERLFRLDPRWRGADNAYTVDLSGGRTLWLFADSFVSEPPTPPGSRAEASEVSGNTIAVMDGRDPTSASMRFYWRHSNGGPAAFFPAPARRGDRLVMWPGHGVRLHAGMILFFQLIRFHDDAAGTPWEFVGFEARMVANPDSEPTDWLIEEISAPQNPYGIVVGSAQVLAQDGHLYAFSSNPTEPIDSFLARWSLEQAEHGDLDDPQWWCGERGWVYQSRLTDRPSVVISDSKTEFTVHRDRATGGFVQVQGSRDYLQAHMMWRWAPALEGPWTAPRAIYRPPELSRERVALYAFKVHPHLEGADLVATYVSLPLDRDVLLSDEQTYCPRVVRLSERLPT